MESFNIFLATGHPAVLLFFTVVARHAQPELAVQHVPPRAWPSAALGYGCSPSILQIALVGRPVEARSSSHGVRNHCRATREGRQLKGRCDPIPYHGDAIDHSLYSGSRSSSEVLGAPTGDLDGRLREPQPPHPRSVAAYRFWSSIPSARS